MKILDYAIIGSGCSGAIAAQTLVEAGVNVTMLDVAVTNKSDTALPAGKSFFDIRNNDQDQYKYIIGDKTQGLHWGKISKGAQVTPPRQYIADKTEELIPLESQTFSPLESLGYGGLGIGWGLQCWSYSEADLKRVGLDYKSIKTAYEVVAKRIGISATRDDAAQYTIDELKNIQSSAQADRNHKYILDRYKRRISTLKRKGVFIGRTPLALLTKKRGGRKAYRYLETDFYSDKDKSAWRPWITIDNLKKQNNFTFIGNTLVTSFKEKGDIIEINALDVTKKQKKTYYCKHLILASGALGTARIVLRSQDQPGIKLPLLSNPHTYIPCIQPALLGAGYETSKLGFGQLSYFIDPEGNDSDISVASSYSYQSLMLFRIITQIPLNFSDGRIISRFLTPGIVILIMQHPDTASANKYLKLIDDTESPTGDRLLAHYQPTPQEELIWEKREKKYMSVMRKLGTYPIKRVRTEHGSAIHYAGTLPFSDTPHPLRLARTGRLHSTKNIYVADSSGFEYLPAKGLTFTLMANAHNVAMNVLKAQK